MRGSTQSILRLYNYGGNKQRTSSNGNGIRFKSQIRLLLSIVNKSKYTVRRRF